MADSREQVLLETKGLKKHFPVKDFFGRKRQEVKAVDGITFQIHKGETFGLVGESGCGKSVTATSIMQLLPKLSRIEEGEIIYHSGDERGDIRYP